MYDQLKKAPATGTLGDTKSNFFINKYSTIFFFAKDKPKPCRCHTVVMMIAW